MRISLFSIILLQIFFAALLTANPAFCKPTEVIKQASVDMKVGYRMDQLDWSTGDPAGFAFSGVPNVLSELTFKDVESIQTRLSGSVDVGKSMKSAVTVHLRGGIAVGSVYAGENTDDDYAGDNRTLEWVQSTADIDGDNTLEWDLAIGPKFYLAGDSIYILPTFGYSFKEAKYNMTDGIVTISDQANADLLLPIFPGITAPPLGPFLGLDSSYMTELKGLTYGLELGMSPMGKFRLITGVKYFSFDYYGEGDWNLRGDLAHPKSFIHDTTGDGYIADAEIDINLSEHWMLTLSGEYRNFETSSGFTFNYLSNGTITWQPFTGANMESTAGMIGLKYNY